MTAEQSINVPGLASIAPNYYELHCPVRDSSLQIIHSYSNGETILGILVNTGLVATWRLDGQPIQIVYGNRGVDDIWTHGQPALVRPVGQLVIEKLAEGSNWVVSESHSPEALVNDSHSLAEFYDRVGIYLGGKLSVKSLQALEVY